MFYTSKTKLAYFQGTNENALMWQCKICHVCHIVFTLNEIHQFLTEDYSDCCDSRQWEAWGLNITHAELFKYKLKQDMPICIGPEDRIERII